MKLIELKCVQPYFDDVWNGKKPCECRFDDRNYEVGDILRLREYIPSEVLDINGPYTGREVVAVVLSMVPKNTFVGLTKGYCLMSLRVLYCFSKEGGIVLV